GVVELAVALQGVADVVQTGPVLLEVRAEDSRPGVIDPGAEQLAGLDLVGVGEDVRRGSLRIARGGHAPGEIGEILPDFGFVNPPGGPGVGVDVDQPRDDRLPRHVDDACPGGRGTGCGHASDAVVGHHHVALFDQLVALHRDYARAA